MKRKNPRRNISRIETEGRNGRVYGGWEVRMQRRGRRVEKFFSDRIYGGRRKALAAAREFRDHLEETMKGYTVRELSRQPSRRNRSGVVGVRLHKQVDVRGAFEYHYWYWVAQWTDAKGRRRTRSFSVHNYGDEEAFRLAREARQQGLAEAEKEKN